MGNTLDTPKPQKASPPGQQPQQYNVQNYAGQHPGVVYQPGQQPNLNPQSIAVQQNHPPGQQQYIAQNPQVIQQQPGQQQLHVVSQQPLELPPPDFGPDQDIILKCELQEMVKCFFKDYAIIWHDPNIESPENKTYIPQLEKFCHVEKFTKWEEAVKFTKETEATCHVITAGTNGELLVKEVFSLDNVREIYIFCQNIEYHSSWAKNYQKISCIQNRIQYVLGQLQYNLLKWYKEASSLKVTLPAFAAIFNTDDTSKMNNLHRYLKVIPNFQNRLQAKYDIVALSRAVCSDEKNLGWIASFEKDYNKYDKKEILTWYTQESFLYKITNNCLRIASSDSILYSRLLLKDIETAIREQYQEKSKSFNGLLYRSTYLSAKEWESLQSNLGQEIEMHGFLSVSKSKKMALKFLRDTVKMVFISILVPKGPADDEQGFAEIEEFSKYPQEREILFNVRSRFTVLETEEKYSEELPCRHLVLLYGAQSFRKHCIDKDPIQEVIVEDIHRASCSVCKEMIYESDAGLFYVSFTDTENQPNICQKCIVDFTKNNNAPLLCVPISDDTEYKAELKGCVMTYPTIKEDEPATPLYGYQCNSCQEVKQQFYLKCTDCCTETNKTYCEGCVESLIECIEGGHTIVLESSPFSFWCEKMSKKELHHWEYQNKIVKEENDEFQQAQMFFESNQHEKAVEFYKTYIEKNEEKMAKLSLRTPYMQIGKIRAQQAKYQEALDCHFKCLKVSIDLFGEDSPDAAADYMIIGDVLDKIGQHEKALVCLGKALAIFRASEKHILVATCMDEIGDVYKTLKDYKTALNCYQQSLEIHQAIYDENSFEMTNSYNRVGTCYYGLQEYEEALEYFKKALEIEASVYGDIHPKTAVSLTNIGNIHQRANKPNEALKYYFKALGVYKSIHGEKHYGVATLCGNIATIYKDAKELDQALLFQFNSLEIFKSLYGTNHHEIAGSYLGMGHIYFEFEDYEKAAKIYSEALKIHLALYGENHTSTAASFNNIASAYEKMEDYERAVIYALKSLSIQVAINPEDYSRIGTTLHQIAMIYEQLGKYEEAIDFYEKTIEIKKIVYGPDHIFTTIIYTQIDMCRGKMDEKDEEEEEGDNEGENSEIKGPNQNE